MFDNLGLTLGMDLKFYASVATKGFELKGIKILGLIPTLVEVTREKLV